MDNQIHTVGGIYESRNPTENEDDETAEEIGKKPELTIQIR